MNGRPVAEFSRHDDVRIESLRGGEVRYAALWSVTTTQRVWSYKETKGRRSKGK